MHVGMHALRSEECVTQYIVFVPCLLAMPRELSASAFNFRQDAKRVQHAFLLQSCNLLYTWHSRYPSPRFPGSLAQAQTRNTLKEKALND